jgi:hypothetical protein
MAAIRGLHSRSRESGATASNGKQAEREAKAECRETQDEKARPVSRAFDWKATSCSSRLYLDGGTHKFVAKFVSKFACHLHCDRLRAVVASYYRVQSHFYGGGFRFC